MSLAELLRSQESPILPEGPDNLIAVASGKGGVGKTFLSVTLAHALARTGRKILLVDGDFGLANAHIHLGVVPALDLFRCISERRSIREAIGTFEDLQFDFIAGRSGVGGLAHLPRNVIRVIQHELIELAQHYAYVIIDLGAGVNRQVIDTINSSGRFLVVSSPDPAALTDAYALIKVAHRQHQHRLIQVVINMAGSKSAAQHTFETLQRACRRFLQIDPLYLGAVRRDERVNRALARRQPLLSCFPSAVAARDVGNIMQGLLSSHRRDYQGVAS